MSVSSTVDTLSRLDIAALAGLADSLTAKGDTATADLCRQAITAKAASGDLVQTDSLANCGKLYRHSRTDSETGRLEHRFVGDIAVFLAPFLPDEGFSGRIDDTLFKGKNSPEARAAAKRDAMALEIGRAALAKSG